MKILNIILFATYLLFTGWQYNDPDVLVWVAIYGTAAGVFGFASFGRCKVQLSIAGFVLYLIGGTFLFARLTSYGLYVEEWRESMGLFIAAAGMGNLILFDWRIRKKQKESGEGQQA